MGCSNSVSADPQLPLSPPGSSRIESEVLDSVRSLSGTVREIRNMQIVTQRKITQSSMGFITVPEKVLQLSESAGSENLHEEQFSSGLVFKDIADSSTTDMSKLFNLIKRGETAQFHAFVQQHFFHQEADIHKLRGMWDSSPLLVAVQYGQYDIAEFLLDHPPEDTEELNRRNEKGCTVVLYVVMEGNVDFFKRLLGLGIKVNIEPTSEPVYNQKYDQSMIVTPLLMAVINNHRRILGLLIDNGCNVDQLFEFSTVKSIRKLSTSGGKVSGVIGMRPILIAAFYGHIDIVRELIWRVCDFHAKDTEQSNILHHLARCKGSDVAELFKFLQMKSCIDDTLLTGLDENGDSPLHIACDLKSIEISTLLLAEGADSSKLNPISGFTPLHIAIRRRDAETVNLLLEYGANPLRRDEKGDAINKLTPLEMASKLPSDSELAKAVNQAANAWSNMRTPALRKSIINLFPDATPVEHLPMPHSHNTVVHQHKKKVSTSSPQKLSPDKSLGSPRPSEPTSDGKSPSKSNPINRIPFTDMFSAITGSASKEQKADSNCKPDVGDVGSKECDEVQEFVALDDSLIEDDIGVSSKEESTHDSIGRDIDHSVLYSEEILTEKDEDEENSDRINIQEAADAFENALKMMEDLVADVYNSKEKNKESNASSTTESSTPSVPIVYRPTPPPPRNSSSTGAVVTTDGSTVPTGGSGNLRRRSLKSYNGGTNVTNNTSIPSATTGSRRLSVGAKGNNSDASTRPPLSKKGSFQGSGKPMNNRRPSISQTPNKFGTKV